MTDKPAPKKESLTLQVLIDSEVAYRRFLKKELKGSFTFRSKQIATQVLPILKNYEETRNSLIEKYGKKDKDGSISIDINDLKAINKYFKELEEVGKTEVTTKIDKLPKNLFQSINISTEDLIALETWLIGD